MVVKIIPIYLKPGPGFAIYLTGWPFELAISGKNEVRRES